MLLGPSNSQARIPEWGCHSLLQGSSRPRGQVQLSCIGRQSLSRLSPREALQSTKKWENHAAES